MDIGIVTDSTCDLPADLAARHGIQVVPSILIMDGRQYTDGAGIVRGDFYATLPHLKPAPTTAAPSIGDFLVRYERLLQGGCQHVLSIHAAGGLTGICEAARRAAADLHGRVTVVDSRSLSLGLGFQVLAASEAAEAGLQACLAAIESTRSRTRLYAALDTLKYARRSGRMASILPAFGALLHIRPIVELADSNVKPIAALRTDRQAVDRLAALVLAMPRLERLAILHTAAEARAREFLRLLMLQHSASMPRDILLVNATPVIGAHIGPNALGMAAVAASP